MSNDIAALAARLDAMEREVARLRDLEDIRDLLTKYSRSLDWINTEWLEHVFYDDAEIDYGFFKGTGKDFKPILMDVERAAGRRWHFTAQIRIDLQGDVAYAEGYNLSMATAEVEAKAGSEIMHFIGWYHDRLERRNGRWGIAARKHVLVSGSLLKESAMDGDMSVLNKVGYADMNNPNYRALGC